jgi:hypothetical protein
VSVKGLRQNRPIHRLHSAVRARWFDCAQLEWLAEALA